MELVDSHAHLDFAAFQSDLDDVLRRAWNAGLVNVVVIGSGSGVDGAAQALALAAADERLYATVGVHPHDADLDVAWKGDPQQPVEGEVRVDWERARRRALERLSLLTFHPKTVAIGEVGLDFHYDHSPRDLQRQLFRDFIRLALSRKLPLVIHAREAEAEVATLLREENASRVGGVVHCFSGDRGLLQAALEMGFYLGLTGTLTFPKAGPLRELVRSIPIERLLVETDAPFLAPVPHRGRRNEPAFVAEVVKVLADLKGLPPEEVAKVSAYNARTLFGIDRREREPTGRIVYPLKRALYVNLTNRCTLACRFCLKRLGQEIGGVPLGLKREPSVAETISAILAEPNREGISEVVFCGIGEPLLRLPEVKAISRWLKDQGLRVRVNTDGLASLVHGRDVPAELVGLVDAVSVSLNAPDAATHARLCPSPFGERAFAAVCEFIRRSVELLPEVTATVVELPGVDLEATRALSQSLGADFRARPLIE